MEKYILALDQGTTSSRAIVFNQAGEIKSMAQKEFQQIFPKAGWVEHNPIEIWSSQISVVAEAFSKIGINAQNIAALGISNQRETTLVWDKTTGNPIYNAIVWQDRRTAHVCDSFKNNGFTNFIKEKTGLMIDAYFSATKIQWILNNVPQARQKALNGELAFGTVDSWLVYKLTAGKKHITDVSNASRTMLYNIHTCQWDTDLLELFDIPQSILPEVTPSSGHFGYVTNTLFGSEIPICGIAGDQQAALFGQLCTSAGMAKSTYGTGCFLLMNTGNIPIISKNNLLTTIAWKIDNEVTYALEGSIFIGGAVVQWLRDQLGIIRYSSEIEQLAETETDSGGVVFVPALTGLGAPHWDQYARGTLIGLTRGTTKGHIARAALEAIAFQVLDVLKAMEADSAININELRVDGGAAINNLLMQFQAEILFSPVIRPKQVETTALGVAYLAGLAVGYWKNLQEIQNQWQRERVFLPKQNQDSMKQLIKKWAKAVVRAKNWEED